MYLTYDIATRELIDFSDDYDGERNIDFGYFVYYNDYIVIVNDENVDFVETRFNEDAQLTVIIPGQYELSFNDVLSVRRFKERNVMFKEAKDFINKLMEEDNLAYYLTIGKIGESTFETKLLEDVAAHFGITVGRVKQLNRNRYEKRIQRLLYIDIAYERFVYSNRNRTENFDTTLEEFKASVHRDIDGLVYTDLTPYSDIFESNLDI